MITTTELQDYSFTDAQVNVIMEALNWTINNGNFGEDEYECACTLYTTMNQKLLNQSK